MLGILILNGEMPLKDFDKYFKARNHVVCCDGAYNWYSKHSTSPCVVVGDMDSLQVEIPKNVEQIKYEKEKDFSDGEIGMDYLINKQCDEIIILGGGGGRDDHAMMNYALLYRALKAGINAKMITNHCQIFLSKKSFEMHNLKNRTITLLPFVEKVHIIKLEGFKYPLEDYIMEYSSTRTLSNIVVDDVCSVRMSSGVLAVFIT